MRTHTAIMSIHLKLGAKGCFHKVTETVPFLYLCYQNIVKTSY